MVPAPQQVINRLSGRFPNDVPAGDLKGTDDSHLGDIRVLVVTAGVDFTPHGLDFKWIRVDNKTFTDSLDQFGDYMGIERNIKGLSPALYSVIRFQLYKDPTPASGAVWVHDICLEVDDFHSRVSLISDVTRHQIFVLGYQLLPVLGQLYSMGYP